MIRLWNRIHFTKRQRDIYLFCMFLLTAVGIILLLGRW